MIIDGKRPLSPINIHKASSLANAFIFNFIREGPIIFFRVASPSLTSLLWASGALTARTKHIAWWLLDAIFLYNSQPPLALKIKEKPYHNLWTLNVTYLYIYVDLVGLGALFFVCTRALQQLVNDTGYLPTHCPIVLVHMSIAYRINCIPNSEYCM